MNKNNKKIILFLSISVVIMTTLFISIAYSYFVAKIKNNESKSTISVAGGEMIINYQDNTGVITASKIIPSWTTTKKFTVSGKNDTKINDVTTDNNIYYKIVLVIDNNTFNKGALTYSLKQDSSSSTNGQMATNSSGTINQSGKQNLGHGYFSTTSTFVNHIYNLTISFPDTGKDQSIDNAKSFAAHVTIEEYNVPTPTTFAEDSWQTIAAVVKENPKAYAVGSTKTLKVYDNPNGETTNGTYKEYTVRVANNTTPKECTNNEDFSQTACGFVVEFADIVESRKRMNPSGEYKGQQYEHGWNVGGWPGSEMRTYANGAFFNNLPEELRKVIIDTKVVSGHGNTTGEENFPSEDKIYLLSAHEVYEDGTSRPISTYDTAYNNTRQLDYYKNKGVTTNSYSGAIKKAVSGSTSTWWLRAALSNAYTHFLNVDNRGNWDYNFADGTYGFAPAFRIGEKM